MMMVLPILLLLVPLYLVLRRIHKGLGRIILELMCSVLVFWILGSLFAEIELSGTRLSWVDYLILMGMSVAPVVLVRLVGLVFRGLRS